RNICRQVPAHNPLPAVFCPPPAVIDGVFLSRRDRPNRQRQQKESQQTKWRQRGNAAGHSDHAVYQSWTRNGTAAGGATPCSIAANVPARPPGPWEPV